MHRSTHAARFLAALLLLVAPYTLHAQSNGSANIASTDVFIAGSSLALEDVTATTALSIPVSLQTSFGGLKNAQAPVVPELLAVGELTGPGLTTPLRLETAPGHSFTIPGLSVEGMYLLQNVRLMRGTTFVQNAVPSAASITVTDILKTKVSVRQLTAAELRARGISVDARNFDVFEYTLSFFVGEKEIVIPFPVIIDKRTHEIVPIASENPYGVPGPKGPEKPPRWSPPVVQTLDLGDGGGLPPGGPPEGERGGGGAPRIPAAIVIPNNMGVMHQFFAVALNVHNNAPAGSTITLDSITATMKNPAELRVADTTPAVSIGRPLPLVDPNTGATFLVAQGKAEAGWTLEGLKTGTHTFSIEVNATYKQTPESEGIPLRGSVSQSIIIHDPRFNITFSHPDTVRSGLTYSTFTFVTNMTSATQTLRLGTELPACSSAGGASVCRLDEDINAIPICNADPNVAVCRPAGTQGIQEVTLKAGSTRALVYKLRSSLTGNIFATAGTVDSDVLHASVQLHMGVSTSGIPLSPATLIMPYYARYLDDPFVTDNLQLLGLGYSLATAPVNQVTAKFPRVIKTDVFRRAVDIARTGQRVFIGEDKRDAFAHLALDLLGNSGTPHNDLEEWDQLRRAEYSGRIAGASLARQFEKASLKTGADFDTFMTRFGAATAHRAPFLVAATHGAPVTGNARPYALSVRGRTTNGVMDLPNELATEDSLGTRNVPYGDLSRVTSEDNARTGELAMVGVWNEDFDLVVTPVQGSSFTLDILYKSPQAARIKRAVFNVSGASGLPLTVTLDPNANHLALSDGSQSFAATISEIQPAPLAIIAAHQDMHLDEDGHKVSVLFNRPPVSEGVDFKPKFAGRVIFQKDSIDYTGPRGVDAAAMQEDGRTLNLTFDHSLSKNASYRLTAQPLTDPLSSGSVTFPELTPILENDNPAAIIYGRVLRGDNTLVPNAQVILKASSVQYDTSSTDKADFLFEYVLRDLSRGYGGAYRLSATDENGKETFVEGAVRLTGVVETINLVYLGRGSAEGIVTYDNGERVANARVVVGSSLFNQMRTTQSNADGTYKIEDLPVGPLTFSATDAAGNTTFAATEIRSPGEVVRQDLSIYRKPFPGTGAIRGIVLRSDTNQPVPGAHVGVYSQGYGLVDGYTGSDGRFEFTKVPAGLVTALAAEWGVSRQSVGVDFELAPDQVKDLTLTLQVALNDPLVNLEGDVEEEDPLAPGTYKKVPNALVQIDKTQVVTADANGHFFYNAIPQSFGGRTIKAYNPASKRIGETVVPALNPAITSYVRIPIASSNAYGSGTVKVRVLNAAGLPVSNYRVIEPGFPPISFRALGNGYYEQTGVPVGANIEVYALPTASSRDAYGEQLVKGNARVAFNGQTALLVLRLPGMGKIRARLFSGILAIGDVNITYGVWDEAEQNPMGQTFTVSTKDANGQAGYAVFEKVPVGDIPVFASLAGFGYDSKSVQLSYDGQIVDVDLTAKKLASIAGAVYAIDGITPMPGVPVRMTDGAQNQGPLPTGLDGGFKFSNVAAGRGFTITAETTQGGIYRVGRADGGTPGDGGPVTGVRVVMKQQGSVEGRVVYSGYKVFDPNDPSKNVLDTTPNDLSDNAPVPLARFYLRELSFPYRSFGEERTSLGADIAGRFLINNVFTGPVRLTAWSPLNQDLRGHGQVTVTQEGETVTVYAAVGTEGFGPLLVTVVDPNRQNQPVENAEVTLLVPNCCGPDIAFDFGTTDANGAIQFEQVPVRSDYRVAAFSKAFGNSGYVQNVSVQPVTGGNVQVSLQFSGTVDGTLTDPQDADAGVPGIPVILTASTYQQAASTGAGQNAGKFFFGGIREGQFTLKALVESSRRIATASGLVSAANPHPTVNLQLEPITSLYVKVYYPNDDGSRSNVEVPVTLVGVKQRCRPIIGGEICEYIRELQGTNHVFTSLFRNEGYGIWVREIGGAQRSTGGAGSFPMGETADNPVKLVLPAFGTVEVTVRQPGENGVLQPAAGARVTAGGTTVTTDTSGFAVINGVGLGDLTVGAVSFDGAFSAYSPVVRLASQSTPLKVTLDLGAYAGLSGRVIAEEGGPSVNTRVLAAFPGRLAQAFTEADGSYKFQGIPVSTSSSTTVSLTYLGPDDRTVGFAWSKTLTAADASKIVPIGDVTLDATPPAVISVTPADNSIDVSPDSSVRIVFTEPIAQSTLNTNNFQLVAADGSPRVNVFFSRTLSDDGKLCTITMTPPASNDPQQKFPLKSNMLYRVLLTGGITDERGHPLVPRGFSFITADYVAPKVIQVKPAIGVPLSASTTFEIHFNKPLATKSFPDSPAPVPPLVDVRLYKITGPGGSIVEQKAGSLSHDATYTQLFFGPNEVLEESTYYRLVLNNVRDEIGNVSDPLTYEWISYDKTAPFITFESPVPAGQPLVSGVRYTLKTVLRNGSATGAVATDVQRVDFFRVEGATKTLLASLTKAPYEYTFVGPPVTTTGSTLTFRAEAMDTSLNNATPQEVTFDLAPNQPPQNVKLTLETAGSIYAGSRVTVRPSLDDEGVLVTLQAQLTGIKSDGSAYASTRLAGQATRAKVGDAWTFAPATFAFDVPTDLQDGSTATITLTAADGVNEIVNGQSATFVVSSDTTEPVITSLTVSPASPYHLGDKYTITAIAKDLESGVSEVVFTYDGKTITLRPGDAGVTLISDRTYRFTTAQITVPAKNDDTRIPILATAKDYRSNKTNAATEVTYIGVHDETLPKGAWVSPIANAAWPSEQTAFSTTLRFWAKDDEAITSVKFVVPGITDPVTATAAGSDIYQATVSVATPVAGTEFTLTALVDDANAAHTQTISIPITLVKVDTTLGPNFTQAITSTNDPLAGKNVLVKGPNAHLVMHVPFTFRNLIVIDGASVETLATTTTLERKLDLTVTDTLYVDSTSIVDVAGRGYLGGWGVNSDGSNTKNEDARGRTVGNSVNGGPTAGSAASHGGVGGEYGGVTNRTYGSIVAPSQLGTGGAGNATCCSAGGAGGGAASIAGGTGGADLARVILAGTIRADGNGGVSAGSGGSIRIRGNMVSLGRNARISAIGGDENGTDNATRGAGGGRISIIAALQLDLDDNVTQLLARGGRNNTSNVATALDGGAGTIYVRRPGQPSGELVIDGIDTNNRQTRATILGYTGSGTSTAITANTLTDASRTFAGDAVGEELTLAGDTTKRYTITAVSGSTLTTDSADGSLLDADGASDGVIDYNGLLAFDAVRVAGRALARFDNALAIGDFVDDASKAAITAPSVLLLRNQFPSITLTTTPASGGSIIRGASFTATYSATSAAGIGKASFAFSPVASPAVDPYFDHRLTASVTNRVIAIPADATLGSATLDLTVTDRSGRTAKAAQQQYTVVENGAPQVTRFDVVPDSFYPGRNLVATISATDDVAVTKITVTSTIGTTPTVQTITPNASTVTDRTFTINVPITTPGLTPMKVDLAVEDGFPGRTATTQTKNLTILKDSNPPSVTITQPTPDQLFQEQGGQTFPIRATITDAEAGVKTVTVKVGEGSPIAMVADTTVPNGWKADVLIPNVDGADTVSFPVVVSANDYELNLGTSSTNIRVQPLYDPNGPVITLLCPTQDALLPAGYGAKLRIHAIGNNVGNASNIITKVEFFINDSQTSIVASPVSGVANTYEATYNIPATAAEGEVFNVRAVATNTASLTSDYTTRFTIVTGTVITADRTVSDTSLDDQTVIVQSGTLTLNGARRFTRLVVLDGARVTHPLTDASYRAVDVNVTDRIYISCGASIDATGQGYSGSSGVSGRTQSGATSSRDGAGGSHGGRGGDYSDVSGSSYGSPFDPNTAGGAGAATSSSGCTSCGAGGGIVRLRAKSIANNGTIAANGAAATSTTAAGGSGAGGSVRIDVETLTGSGAISANGGSMAARQYAGGGGGRIAVYYQSLSTFNRSRITANGVRGDFASPNSTTRHGSNGTVYFRAVDASGASVADELVVDNESTTPRYQTTLPKIGTGTVTAVSGATLTLSGPVEAWTEGAYLEILDASGAVKSAYPVAARISSTSITVTLPNGVSAANASAGDAYRGTWRFDAITARNTGSVESDGLNTPLVTTSASGYLRFNRFITTPAATVKGWIFVPGTVRVPQLTIEGGGRLEVSGTVTATNLTVRGSSMLRQMDSTIAAATSLAINADAISIEAGSSIEATGSGYTGSTGDSGTTHPSATSSRDGAGGSHGGRGGDYSKASGSIYGSVFDPNTPGGAGGTTSSSGCASCNPGGGVLRITAKTIANNGAIAANGWAPTGSSAAGGSGAGGSIRLDVETLSGSGVIAANGGNMAARQYAAGGGGRVAIYYRDLTAFDRTKVTANGMRGDFANANTTTRHGGAGTVYFRQLDASGNKVSDELVIDNASTNGAYTTSLARIGTGTITAINGNTLTVSGPVAAWVEGAFLEILDATGAVKSAYPVATRVSDTSIILTLPSGASAPNASVGDAYRGAWRIDQITARNSANLESDGLTTPVITTSGSGWLRFDRLVADAITVRGWIFVPGTVRVPQLTIEGGGRLEVSGTVTATNLTVRGNSMLRQIDSTIAAATSLAINADAISIEAGSSIEATGSGYTGSTGDSGTTHPSATSSRDGAGGSHGGRGGDYSKASGSIYGSVFDPNTPGGAGGTTSSSGCASCNPGGGVLRITAKTIANNGAIAANGWAPTGSSAAGGSGAGGSIRLDVETLSGSGVITANGGNMAARQYAAGGGGRVAIYYRDLTAFDRTKVTANGMRGDFANANTTTRHGGAGTVYFRQLDASGNKVSDELVVDNASTNGAYTTSLARIGTGTITAINGNTLTVSGPVAAWVEGAFLEILDATGAVKSAYPVATRVSDTSIILTLPSGASAPNASVGDAYRGAWRIDQITARNSANLESDGLNTPLVVTANAGLLRFDRLIADAVTVKGLLQVTQLVRVPQLVADAGARLEVNGRVEAADIAVKGNSAIAQLASTKTGITSLTVDASASITIDAGSSINGDGAGYTGSTGDSGSTHPGATSSRDGAGGSHGGRGGDYSQAAGSTYGSIFNPSTPGAAGGTTSSSGCTSCNPGGGVLRIITKTLTNNGAITANGAAATGSSTAGGTGAGGSIRLDVETLTGSGAIAANGGSMAARQYAGGGGGRVAVYYQSLGTFDRAKITANGMRGDFGGSNANRAGSPGTVYLKSSAQTYGDLILDNAGTNSAFTTKLTSVGYRTVDELTASSVRDIGASLAMPSQLTGIRLFVNGNKALSWPILTNTAETVNVDVSANALATAAGQQFRGLQKFDTITLKFAKIDIEDIFESVAPLSKDANSSVAGSNEGAPVIDVTKISIQTSPTGASAIGLANAIVDVDKPVTFTLINGRTGGTFPGSVNNDGSFVGSVTGNAGDAILLKAKDGSVYPLETAAVEIGTLPASTPVPTQIARSEWSPNAAFRADTLSLDGKTLAVASHVNISGADSNQVVFLDLSDPSRPALRRTVATVNRVLDVKVVNGWAYVAGDRFGTINAEDPSAVMNFTNDLNGRDYSVAVSGGYAFTAEVDWNNNGTINIYDVSNPAAPRYIRQQAVAGFGDVAFHDLVAFGSDYILGICGAWGGSGRDVIVIDRRDVNGLVKTSEVLIPDFTAWRGKVHGTKLYLADKNNAKIAVVDLANPAAPVVAGVLAIGAPNPGIDVVGNDVLVAATTAGLITTTADPANLRTTGSVATGGTASDVASAFGYAYVANQTGLAVVPISVAPTIDTNRITLAYDGSSVAITGAVGAVTGTAVKVKITDTTANASVDGITVAADGSFTASLPAASGDAITLTATDALERIAGPVSLGYVPFGTSVTQVIIANPEGQTDWRARTIKAEGNNLAVASFPHVFGDSSRIILYDITNPAAPVLKRTLTTVNRVLDFEIVNGWAYVAGDRFGTIDLNNPSSAMNFTNDLNGRDYSVAVSGGYAFTAEVDWNNNGTINIYDVSNPAVPRYIRQQAVAGFGGHAFTDLIAYGSDYLIGISSWTSTDVMVIDRRDINGIFKVGQLQIPQIDAFRGKIVGNKLYLGSWSGGSAIVDLSNPAAPVVLSTSALPTMSRGVEIAGSTMAVANGGSGVQFYDVAANTLVKTGVQPTGGMAWDVALGRAALYVANDQGIVIINNVSTPPQLDARLVSVSAPSETLGTVAGVANAVTGLAPLSVEVKNTASGATMTVTAQADGSFSVSLPAQPGEAFTVKVTDASNRSAGPVVVGTMPFGSAVTKIPIVNPAGDTDWRARTIKAEGNNLAIASFPHVFGDSSRIVLYDITNPAAPVLKRTLTTVNRVLDFEIVNGWAYVAGDRFGTIDLNNPSSAMNFTNDLNGRDYSVAVSGGYAFTGEVDWNNDGRINIYDVSNPAVPRFIRQQNVAGFGGHAFTDLIAYGSDYLIGISSWTSADVMVIDRRNINGIFKVAQLEIPQIDAFRGKIVGNKLYLSSWSGGSAIVDLSNPAAPVVVSTASASTHTRGVDVAGSTMALANAGLGVRFFDVTTTLASRGFQPTDGVAWDVALSRGMLYVAADQGLVVVHNVAAPPQIDTRLISVTSDGTNAIVTGAAAAITGQGSITADVKDTASGAVTTVSVNANGSFTATFPSAAGSVITLKATDGNGRTAGPVNVGTVPFGSALTMIPIANPDGDGNWRARTIKAEGNNLAIAAFPDVFGDSPRIVLYDITNAAAPVLKRTLNTVNRILDFEIVNGWAYVAGDRFGTIDLNNPASTMNLTNDLNGRDYSVAVSGGYAFTGEVDWNNDGRINIYDVSNPAAPRYLSQQAVAGFGGHAFTDLIAYGGEYLIGISSWGSTDVMVIDRRDVNGLFKVAQLQIPQIDAFRGKIVGTKLYLSSWSGGTAIVELANPAAPAVVAVSSLPAMTRGLDLAGASVALANGASGAQFFDVSANTLRSLGYQATGGVAWDVAFAAGNLYVAADQGLAIIENVGVAPDVDPSRISISTISGGSATVSGSARAIGGAGATTVSIANTANGASVNNVSVNADGTFTASILAQAGNKLTLTATDAASRVSTRAIGQVPFANVTTDFRATHDTDSVIARRILTDGNSIVAGPGTAFGGHVGGSANTMAIFPGQTTPTLFNAASGAINAMAMRGSWGYFAAEKLSTVNFAAATPTRILASGDPSGRDMSVAVIGNYAYTGEGGWNDDARINIWNVTDPAAPAYVGQQAFGPGGTDYISLMPYSATYMIGLTANAPGTAGDVAIFDLTNPTSISRVKVLDIPSFSGNYGVFDDATKTLYVASSSPRMIAVVDLTTPTNPVLRSTFAPPGVPANIAVSGTNEIVIADGGTGLTFVDVTNKSAPVVLGSQQLPGNAKDVKVIGNTIYAATETRMLTLQRP